ncbi:MAG: GGDEF domain-containing protein, partial [Anaerolineae bacterium]|nr:GGDEF domain-containing protein [Anaerolineae bacterium]
TRIIGGIPTGLIMRINKEDIEVFVSSNNDKNPYTVGDKEHLLGSGLYCETVINKQAKLLVPNALKSNEWKNNPDIKLNMISYLGFPINWPDGTPFGTICVLDEKENKYSSDIEEFLGKFRNLIQMDLELVTINYQLERLAETDSLTGVLNRRALYRRAEIEIERAVRHEQYLSVFIIDVDCFKLINDSFGHQIGDDVLIELTEKVRAILRKIDLLGRFGGDEFIIVLPETTIDLAKTVGERICALAKEIRLPDEDSEISFTVSIGIAEFGYGDTFTTIVNRADKALLRAKGAGRNQVCIEKI